jgi:hypothetical protein
VFVADLSELDELKLLNLNRPLKFSAGRVDLCATVSGSAVQMGLLQRFNIREHGNLSRPIPALRPKPANLGSLQFR